MTKLTEVLVGIGIIAAMAAATVIPSGDVNGSWGVEPTAQVREAIGHYLLAVSAETQSRGIASRRLLRSSAPKAVRDLQLKQTIQAVKAEFVEEYEPGVSFGGDLPPRRYTVVIGFDGGKPLRWFYVGKGPKEYREAF